MAGLAGCGRSHLQGYLETMSGRYGGLWTRRADEINELHYKLLIDVFRTDRFRKFLHCRARFDAAGRRWAPDQRRRKTHLHGGGDYELEAAFGPDQCFDEADDACSRSGREALRRKKRFWSDSKQLDNATRQVFRC